MARRRLTAEFGMGSGLIASPRATRPAKNAEFAKAGRGRRVEGRRRVGEAAGLLSAFSVVGRRALRRPPCERSKTGFSQGDGARRRGAAAGSGFASRRAGWSVALRRLSFLGLFFRFHRALAMGAIKSNERLVPVGWRIAAFSPPVYRRGGLPRLFGENWF